jgi:hypothetical protein
LEHDLAARPEGGVRFAVGAGGRQKRQQGEPRPAKLRIRLRAARPSWTAAAGRRNRRTGSSMAILARPAVVGGGKGQPARRASVALPEASSDPRPQAARPVPSPRGAD